MLHPSFPKPMKTTIVIITDSTHTDLKATTNGNVTTTINVHTNSPTSAKTTTTANANNNTVTIINNTTNTTINTTTSTITLQITLPELQVKVPFAPYARHTPIPVPYHWTQAIKQSLDKDVEMFDINKHTCLQAD